MQLEMMEFLSDFVHAQSDTAVGDISCFARRAQHLLERLRQNHRQEVAADTLAAKGGAAGAAAAAAAAAATACAAAASTAAASAAATAATAATTAAAAATTAAAAATAAATETSTARARASAETATPAESYRDDADSGGTPITVFATVNNVRNPTGSCRYHRTSDCPGLLAAKAKTSLHLSAAKNLGLTPCQCQGCWN